MMGNRPVDIARSWIGTPYVHQGAAKHVGTDCLGLIRGIWRELAGDEPAPVPAYSATWGPEDQTDALYHAAMQHLVAQPASAPPAVGDVLLFRMRAGAAAKHLGIQSQIGATPYFIHAYSGHAVTESPLSAPWARKIVARFQFPDALLNTKE